MVLNVLGRLRELPFCDYLSLAGESDGSGGESERRWYAGAVGVEFRVLGRPEVRHDGLNLDIGPPKQRSVLSALLFSTNEAVSTERLVESVWWQPPLAAGSNLRSYLAGLRRILHLPGEYDSRLYTERAGGYRISVRPGELDLDRFDELTRQGERALQTGGLATAADHLERALRLWRGRALDGVTYGPALQAMVTRVEERRLVVAEEWAQARLDLGQPEAVTADLRGLVREHPLRERLWAHLMLALHRSGRPSEALAVYAELRTVLAGELGVDPAPEVRRLHQQILQGAAVVDHPKVDSRPTVGVEPTVATPRQLPAGTSTLYGRATELARLDKLLSGNETRRGPILVAVDGVAGVGKSALALAAASRNVAHFPGGQFYVDLQGATPGLAPLRPIDVLGRFLRTLGVRPASVPDDEAEAAALFRSLVAQRRVLVLLDDAVSLAQVRPLLPGGPGCAALITSREALTGLAETVRVPLGLLTPPDAVTLLGSLTDPGRVAAEPEAAARVAALCGFLPLALGIAAARLVARPGWPLAALADRLAAAQHRLDELAVAHLAVRSSIELTYRGLPQPVQTAFRRLGLLKARNFPAWALAALMNVPVPQAERLIDDLLTVRLLETTSVGLRQSSGELHYRFHDLVRLYAQEQAVEKDPAHVRTAAVRRLSGACLALAERAEAKLSADFLGLTRHRVARWSLPRAEVERLTTDPRAWFDQEHAFLIAAVENGIERGIIGLAGCLAASLTTFFQVGNHFDDWRRVQTAALVAAEQAGDQRTAMKLHRGLGELDTIQDRYDDAMKHFISAHAASTDRDPEHVAAISAGLGYLHRLRGEYDAALSRFTEARQLAEATGNLNGLVYATSGIGAVQMERGQLTEAVECFEECLRLSQEAGYLPGAAQARRCLGHVYRTRGDHDAAAIHFAQAKEISESLGDRLGSAHAACWLGEMRVRQGRHTEGRRLLAQCLWIYRDFANEWGEAGTLWALAVAQLAVGRPRMARHRAAQAVAMWRRLGSPHWLSIGLATLAEAYDVLGEPVAAEQARQEADQLRRELDRR
ncbi:BTAD domain-containing putative transcriptional regulator [Micromonospora sp. NPDC003197]